MVLLGALVSELILTCVWLIISFKDWLACNMQRCLSLMAFIMGLSQIGNHPVVVKPPNHRLVVSYPQSSRFGDSFDDLGITEWCLRSKPYPDILAVWKTLKSY